MASQVEDIARPFDAEKANEKPTATNDTPADPDFNQDTELGQHDKLAQRNMLARHDAFGNEESVEVRYKVLKWWQGGLLMVAETISLGILSLPAAVAGLGMAPGMTILVMMGLLASYNGYVIGQLKWRFPFISTMADAGEVLMGRFGRELLGWSQLLLLAFICASHVLTFTVALNVITDHGTCSIVFSVVSLVISLALSLPRTLAKMSWLSLVSFTSIFIAVLIAMIGTGIGNPQATSKTVVQSDLATGFGAVTSIVFAYASHNSFFTFMAELSDPKDFPKALALLQSIDISLYVIAAAVIYYYAGTDVTSPALGSASPTVAKVAYGIALPTIIIAGVLNGHIAAKQVYLRLFAGTSRIHQRDWIATGSWMAIVLVIWIIAWIIGEAIPIFSNLLGLIASLFLSWFSFGLPGIFWLFMNKRCWFSSPRKVLLALLNCINVGVGVTLFGLGLYTSGKAIHDSPTGTSFSCADNS